MIFKEEMSVKKKITHRSSLLKMNLARLIVKKENLLQSPGEKIEHRSRSLSFQILEV